MFALRQCPHKGYSQRILREAEILRQAILEDRELLSELTLASRLPDGFDELSFGCMTVKDMSTNCLPSLLCVGSDVHGGLMVLSVLPGLLPIFSYTGIFFLLKSLHI